MTPKLLNADWNYWPEKHPADAIWRSSAALGFDGIELGVYDAAEQLSEARVAEYQALGEQRGIADSLRLLGLNALYQGQFEEGEHLLLSDHQHRPSQHQALSSYCQLGLINTLL